MSVRPAKTQISLGIRPVWSESLLCAHWVAKDPGFLHADSEDSDQTWLMPRLIWVSAWHTLTLFVLSCRGSYCYSLKFNISNYCFLNKNIRYPVFGAIVKISTLKVHYTKFWKLSQDKMDRVKRIWYLSPMRAAKVQASLRIRAVSPEPSLLAHTSSESRGTFRQKARSLALLNGWACAVKLCHDGMLEDTNSLDGAHIVSSKCNTCSYVVVTSLDILGPRHKEEIRQTWNHKPWTN